MRGYGIFSVLYLMACVVFTKIFFRPARIIRLPVSIRFRNRIKFGHGFTTGVGCRIDALVVEGHPSKTKIYFGTSVQINDYVHIAAVDSIVIGNDVLIASKVFITDHNHGSYSSPNGSDPMSKPASRPLVVSPVVIRDNVWIGEFVSILPGVTIGKGSVIGSNTIVTSDIPEYSIAVGSPARVVKRYDFELEEWVRV
jgi:lipopolysaccharide O-acetyltransferase